MPNDVSEEEVNSDKQSKVNNHIESGEEGIPWGELISDKFYFKKSSGNTIKCLYISQFNTSLCYKVSNGFSSYH